MDTMGNTWGQRKRTDYWRLRKDLDGSSGPAVLIYLVGQRDDHPKRAILVLHNIRVDHIPDKQVEVKGGSEADGQAYGQPPLWEELQWDIFQLRCCRQRASVQDGQTQLGCHGSHRLFGLAVVSAQVNLEREQSQITSLLWFCSSFYFYISAFVKTMIKGTYRLQRLEWKMNRGLSFGSYPVFINTPFLFFFWHEKNKQTNKKLSHGAEYIPNINKDPKISTNIEPKQVQLYPLCFQYLRDFTLGWKWKSKETQKISSFASAQWKTVVGCVHARVRELYCRWSAAYIWGRRYS